MQRRVGIQIDEAQDFFLMSTAADLGELVARLEHEGHPPLHYLVERAVVALSTGADRATVVQRLQSLNVALATLTVALLMVFCWREFGPATALLAGALAGASPFLVFHASMARPYALFGLLSVVHLMALTRFLRRNTYGTASAWGVSAALLAYTHYYAIFVIAGGGLYALLRRLERANAMKVALAGGVCVVLFLPWLPSLRAQLAYDLQPWFSTRTGLSKLLYVVRVPAGRWAMPLLLYGLIRGALWTRSRPEAAAAFWVCAFSGFGAGLLAYLAQFAGGPLHERYVLPMVWSVLPAVAFGWAYLLEATEPVVRSLRGRVWLKIPAPRGTTTVAVTLLGLVICLAWMADPHRWCLRGTSPSARYAELIESEGRDDDLVWVQPAARCADLLFHYDGDARVVAPPYGERPYYTDWVEYERVRNEPELATRYLAELERHLEGGGRVWLIVSYPTDAAGVADAQSGKWWSAPLQLYDLGLLDRALERLNAHAKPVQSIRGSVTDFHDPLHLVLFDPNATDR
jgi:hypothetical protein